jgi:heparosan-N-sulfate-glucuronate 5-epimerase
MKLGKYYIDLNLSLGEDFSEYQFSSEGVPLTNFNRKPDWQHNPVTVCQYGLHHFNIYLREQNERSKEIFLIQANWLVQNAEHGANDSKVWNYRIDIPFYQITAPWISGMAQGEALSVLLRAHQLTDNQKYLDTAIGTWKIFQVLVQNGGVIAYFPNGSPIIEEYPSTVMMTGVLNGFISAIFGVYDFAQYLDDKQAEQFFLKLVASLKHNLNRYDRGYWSYYDQRPPMRLTSKAYHRLHIEQLKALYEITGDDIFKNYSDQWQGYLKSSKCKLKWMVRKIRQKLFD